MAFLDLTLLLVTSYGGLYMIYRGIKESKIYEMITGLSFAVVACAVIIAEDLHGPVWDVARMWWWWAETKLS